MLLIAHTSKLTTAGASLVEGVSRDQIWISSGADMLDSKSYLGLEFGSRLGCVRFGNESSLDG